MRPNRFHARAAEEFDTVCPSHDDYIRASVASSQAPQAVGWDRTRVAMSTCYVCDSDEKEADEIVKTAFAPTLNAHVKEGKVAAWNWLEHVAGGKYRLAEAHPALSQLFIEICDSHSDCIWDMGTE